MLKVISGERQPTGSPHVQLVMLPEGGDHDIHEIAEVFYREISPQSTEGANVDSFISKLPVRQVTQQSVNKSFGGFSKLPVRQVTAK